MSAILREALDRYGEMRDDYELHRHARYVRAVEELRGELLSKPGRAQGIDDYSLFMGPEARAKIYASEDLWRWWQVPGNERVTVRDFEEQWLRQRDEGQWT